MVQLEKKTQNYEGKKMKLLNYYYIILNYIFSVTGIFFFLGSSSNFENQIRTPIDIYIYLINLNNITIFNL